MPESESVSEGICPLCGEPNSHARVYCRRCNYRLPWADALEGITDTQRKSIMDEAPWLDHELKQWGLLPERTLACRYCNQPIKVDDKQCPHCKEWLVSAQHLFELDPWQPDYRDKDTERVAMIGPRTGCFSILPLIIVAIGLCLL